VCKNWQFHNGQFLVNQPESTAIKRIFAIPQEIFIFKMSQQNQAPENQLQIELNEEMAEGTYSNLAIITHSNGEFVVDFVNIMPNTPKARVKSRIILTPQHAKRLMRALTDNVKKFEAVNGPIKDTETQQLPMVFNGPVAQA
jgi:hypothetical protein